MPANHGRHRRRNHQQPESPDAIYGLIDSFSKMLLHGDLSDDVRKVLSGYLQPGDAKQPLQLTPDLVDTRVRAVVHLMLSTPIYQLN